MQQGSKFRSKENQTWDGLYGRIRRDEQAAALFVQLAEKDAALRTERAALFVQASLTVQDAQHRLHRAERFGRTLGAGLRWFAFAPLRAVSSVWRFGFAMFRSAFSPEGVADPLPGRFLEDRQLLFLVFQRAMLDPVMREEMLKRVDPIILARRDTPQLKEVDPAEPRKAA